MKYYKQLTALKSLYVDCGGERFSSVMEALAAAHIPSESLGLELFHMESKLITGISQCTQSNVLELSDKLEESIMALSDVLVIVSNLTELSEVRLELKTILITDLVGILRCAPKLQTFHYSSRVPSSVETELFMDIRDVLVERKEKRRLDLFLTNAQLNVAKELLKKNADILKIKCICKSTVWDLA